MPDRLLIGVLGNRNSGKSTTWNTLFRATVRRGQHPRLLTLRPDECAEVFLVSGSFEERKEYAGDILANQDCRIVLCSLQYTTEVQRTFTYLIENNFFIFLQWLNPGYNDAGETWDRLGLVNQILSVSSVVSIRNGKADPVARVQEIGEFIYGWAKYRNLIIPCGLTI
jgi:hypothetical protein